MDGYFVRRRLRATGVKLETEAVVEAITPEAISYRTPLGTVTAEGADIVLVTQRVSTDDLFQAVRSDPAALDRASIDNVFRIGDCVAPRLLMEIIFDGHRLAREIDSHDPGQPRDLTLESRRDAGMIHA
jgi:dimethylamine/trimethylamine dehydrogenase